MANVRTLTRSFAGGEITPELYGRLDLAGFQTGLATCRNFMTLPHGPAANRPGFAFVRAVKTSGKRTKLIPFSYSTTQTMVLEFGEGYIRFHTNGATLESSPGVPYEVVSPYTESDLFDLHYVQSADVLTIVHPGFAPRELRRLGALSWSLTAISFVPTISAPTGVSATSSSAPPAALSAPTGLAATSDGAGATSYSYRVVAYHSSDERSQSATTSATAINVASWAELTWNAVVGANRYKVYRLSGATYGYMGTTIDRIFRDDFTGAPDTTITPTTYTPPAGMTTQTYVVTAVKSEALEESVASGEVSCTNNLSISGAYNGIAWSAVAGATRYNVYKEDNGLFGYIGQTSELSFRDENITADVSQTPPVANDPFATAGNMPGAVSYFEQRRDFAGTLNKPQSMWMTRTGTESNLSSSIPTRDDDAITFRIAAREANSIRHIVPLSDLILLTSSAEWRVTSVNSDAITPTSIQVRPLSYVGANNVQPAVAGASLLYAAAKGGRLRELTYGGDASGRVSYQNTDVSLMAPHLFDFKTVVDLAFARTPYPILWAVSSDGVLLGLTYVPDQKAIGWHQHDTDGDFESVCVVTEGSEDALYAVIKRNINGADVRYVERMHSRQFETLADSYFVDCGATYSGAPATVISGLSHLEGETVAILADGAVMPQKIVTGGQIIIDEPASKVHVGLPITADIKTLPVATEAVQAFGQGRVKNVNKVWMRVYRSSGVFAGPDNDHLREYKQRRAEPYGSPPSLIESEEIEISLDANWNQSGHVFVRQSAPLPLTISSMSLEVALGG